jgi:hypothetical protein
MTHEMPKEIWAILAPQSERFWLPKPSENTPWPNAKYIRSDLAAQDVAELVEALAHMQVCAVCAQSWDDCEQGIKALALLAKHGGVK